MKRYILIGIASLMTTALTVADVAAAVQETGGMTIEKTKLTRNASLMTVGLRMNLSELKVQSSHAAVFVPIIVNGADSLRLPAVGVYGRTRWYQTVRSGSKPLGGADETSYLYSERPDVQEYSQNVPYEEWMNGSHLIVRRFDYGCANCGDVEQTDELAAYSEVQYQPVFVYKEAVAEAVKMRELAGRAYIDFPVNRTELYPDYRKNPTELAKIIATIDSVRNDKDVTVKRITIKGWASPESPWENNTRLAKGRTATLKQYVQNLYRFPEGFIETDYYPEDWFGLREFVDKSNLPHREEILALIDDDTIAPDPKEDKLKKTYPEEYKFLLATVYPGLRHSDYTIEYTIRSFTDVNEIAEVIKTEPKKLSLNEMYLLAGSLESGSDEYAEVFATAARMYPHDATANLNAANAEMSRGNLSVAERYLSKAGDSAEAEYARGVLRALRGDYTGALELIEKAQSMGLAGREDVIDHIKEVSKYQND